MEALSERSNVGLDVTIKTFINQDGSVDGEVRIGNLPEEWKTEDGLVLLEEWLSQVLRNVGLLVESGEGGRYFISIGVRFGPNTEAEIGNLAELYRRFKGLFQVAAHPTWMGMVSGIQNNVASLGIIIKSLMQRRGLPPSAVFIRLTWTPDGKSPGRYEGEAGGGR
jgi:hypothetical protein